MNFIRLSCKLDALKERHQIHIAQLSPEIQQMAKDPSQKIAAIKLHRDQNPGMRLQEVKANIENFGKSI